MDIKSLMGGALQGAPLKQQMPQEQPKRKGPGFGDILSEFIINYGAGAGNPLASGILQNRLSQQRQSAQQQAQERMYERKRADGKADKQWEWENKPKNPHRWESNDGSLMELGPDGKPRVAYKDPNPRMDYKVVKNPDGTTTMYPVPLGGGGGVPSAPVGKLRPIGATTQNTPAPQLGTNGMPQMLSRQQYLATVNAMGKEKTDAWIARNNVQVGAQ